MLFTTEHPQWDTAQTFTLTPHMCISQGYKLVGNSKLWARHIFSCSFTQLCLQPSNKQAVRPRFMPPFYLFIFIAVCFCVHGFQTCVLGHAHYFLACFWSHCTCLSSHSYICDLPNGSRFTYEDNKIWINYLSVCRLILTLYIFFHWGSSSAGFEI